MNPDAPYSGFSRELSPQAACPICSSVELKPCPPGRDRLFGIARGMFTLFQCKSCKAVFQHPMPTSELLAGYYPKEYWWSEVSAQPGRCARLFRKLEKAYREFVIKDHVRFLEYCARDNAEGGRALLDIGCGNGTFLHAARSRGFKPHGMDASARAVEIAGTQYGLPVRQGEIGGNAWRGSCFDFVTMFHVLEHLPDPRLALRAASELLRPGGALIIQVPNIASVQARLLGRYWYGFDVPRHVINFTPESLSLLLREMAFEFTLVSRFSLRDNPTSIVSSLFPRLDPVRRKGRGADSNPMVNGLLELLYFGVFILAIPAAWLESALGFGATIWVCARPKRPSVASRQPSARHKTAFTDD